MNTVLPFSESELVYGIQAKNQEAFSNLYDIYSAAIFGVIKKMISNPKYAEDILQNVFIKIWNCGHQYVHEKGTLYSWMLRIAHHETLNYLHSKEDHKKSQPFSIVKKNSDHSETEFISGDGNQIIPLQSHPDRVFAYLNQAGYSSGEIGTLLQFRKSPKKN